MQLMISLDKKMLQPNSSVARRMLAYGAIEPLQIIVPASNRVCIKLSPQVQIESSGGQNKPQQLWYLFMLGKQIFSRCPITSISTQDPFFTGFLGVLLARKFRVPLTVQVHGDFYSSDYYKKSGVMNRLRYHLGKWALRRADHIRVVGERVRTSLLSLGIVADRIEVRPIPIPTETLHQFTPAFSLHDRYPSSEKIFLVLGRLDPVKNIAWLINCFAEIKEKRPKYHLLIVGDGGEKERLQALAKDKNLGDTITFEDWTADPWSYIKDADCLLFPSLSEGYGLVVMEALALDTPVIMTDVGVANYEVKSGPKATIVPINDREKFIQAVLHVTP